MKITDEMVAAFKAAFHDESSLAETYDESVRTGLSAALAAQEALTIPDNWLPTSENINALPGPVRKFIHDLHTNCDPAGMVRENALLRDRLEQLDELIRELQERDDGD